VDGDGDVRLAKRPLPAAAQTTAAMTPAGHTAATIRPSQPKGQPADGASPDPAQAGNSPASMSAAAGDGTAVTAPAVGGPPTGRARRKVLLAAAAAAVAVTGGVIATLVLLPGGSGGNSQASGSFYTSRNPFTANAPWRLKIEDNGYGNGCSLWIIDTQSGTQTHLADNLYVTSTFQISDTGTFRWRVNDPRCNVVALPGTGTDTLPFSIDQSGAGDTAVFAAPASVAVRVKDWHGDSSCDFRLYDPASGGELDFATVSRGQNDTVTLDPGGRKTVYLALENCGVEVSAAR
jgi:hypothetical protein